MFDFRCTYIGLFLIILQFFFESIEVFSIFFYQEIPHFFEKFSTLKSGYPGHFCFIFSKVFEYNLCLKMRLYDMFCDYMILLDTMEDMFIRIILSIRWVHRKYPMSSIHKFKRVKCIGKTFRSPPPCKCERIRIFFKYCFCRKRVSAREGKRIFHRIFMNYKLFRSHPRKVVSSPW